MWAFQRFLQDFAAGSNTLDADSQESQEYEDDECSQIYLSGLDEAQIVDEENESISSAIHSSPSTEFTRRTSQVRVASQVRVTSQVRVRSQIFF